MLARSRWGVVGASILLASCGGTPSATDKDEPPAVGIEGETAADSPSAIRVELLEAGAQPRRPLRLTATVGAYEEWVLAVQSKTVMATGDEEPTTRDLPAAIVLVELKLAKVSSDGNRVYDVLIGAVPTMAAGRADVLAHGKLVVTDRGIPVDFSVELGPPGQKQSPPTQEPESKVLTGPVGIASLASLFSRQNPDPTPSFQGGDARMATDGQSLISLQDHLVPFPVEPVGRGAKWRVTSTMAVQGLRGTEITEYELVELYAGGATLRATIVHKLEDKTFNDPDLDVTVERFESSGNREVRVLFNRVLPAGSQVVTLDSAMRFRFKGTEDSEEHVMKVKNRQTIRLAAFGEQSLSPFPTNRVSSLSRTLWWQLNFCMGLGGKRDGAFTSSKLSGQCVAGVPDGVWTSQYAPGKPQLRGEFANGIPVGTWTQWALGDKPVGTFEMKAGNGTVSSWWPDGTKRLDVVFRNGKPDGAFHTWFANGRPHLAGSFSKGEKVGLWQEWGHDGASIGRMTLDPGCRLVVKVVDGSPAANASIAVGDVILEVNGALIEEPTDIIRAVEKAGAVPLRLSINRNGAAKIVNVTPAREAGEPPRIGVMLGCQTTQER